MYVFTQVSLEWDIISSIIIIRIMMVEICMILVNEGNKHKMQRLTRITTFSRIQDMSPLNSAEEPEFKMLISLRPVLMTSLPWITSSIFSTGIQSSSPIPEPTGAPALD